MTIMKCCCITIDVFADIASQPESEVVVGRTETESSSALYVAVSCACALVTVFAIALLACYLRNNKGRRHGEMLQSVHSLKYILLVLVLFK